MKTEETKDPESELEVISIKERVKAANYAIKVKGSDIAEEDVSDVIGEVYGG